MSAFQEPAMSGVNETRRGMLVGSGVSAASFVLPL